MEQLLVRYCSPTLAGIKTAGLFNYAFSDKDGLERSLAACGRLLNGKGVFIEALKVEGFRALLYVYRKSRLEEDLRKDGVPEFLSRYGYRSGAAADCLAHLKRRFDAGGEFPHEIGIFLGYPLEDVTGFIENAGQNSKCIGCWKVYSDEYTATALFEKYKKCRCIYEKMFSCGRSVSQLTVAA
ncbi:Protein of unknown function [Sporobacter termitidis DSM 10068]|uniref:DUF3793 family protein n=1 Tax=Sporobacter termitidis DSM 10068 TaxID=1123282 RepID=A0A1M5XHM9_9FIRM|nr:DUF3793 family protein [Sporobacter termitidis]SHH99375.1 Protein of unknown function [Sporobacter termitidis DSM 10068]